MPAVVVDSSVLISLAAGEQFHLLRPFYSVIYIPPAVWTEEWLIVQTPRQINRVTSLPFNLQPGETQALALALELSDPLLLVDDAQGRRAAAALNMAYTGTLGRGLRGKAERKIPHLRSVLELLKQRTTFWLSQIVYEAALKQARRKFDIIA